MTNPKKKLSIRIYEALFPPKRTAKRQYAAARPTRTNANWTTFPTSANYELKTSLAGLRARAREAARDNSHIKKFLGLCRSNIIGPKGIMLQSRARLEDGQTLNVELNKAVEEAWWLWGHKETCTVSGKLDWLAVQRLIVTQLARDGEFLVQKIAARNPFGFSLKVWNVDYLDETYNDTRPDGNRVIMSVEIDADDRPVAYWLTTPSSEINFTRSKARQRVRVPADQMIHGFLCYDDESQVRGVTWLHAALLDAKNFQSYREGVINSARMTAHSMGFLEQTVPDGEEYTGAETDEGEPVAPQIDVTPLSFNALPPGWTMKPFDPKQPTQNHAAYSKTVLMDVATGLDVPYFDLAGDMEAVNFSSSRVGLDASRETWKTLQDFVATNLCREVFKAWSRAAFMKGALQMTARDFAEIQNPAWRARGWKYIDPTKDVAADVEKLANNLTTWTDVLNEQGIDLVDFLEKRKAEIETAAAYGIDLTIQPKMAAADPTQNTGDTGDPPQRSYTNGHDAELLN